MPLFTAAESDIDSTSYTSWVKPELWGAAEEICGVICARQTKHGLMKLSNINPLLSGRLSLA